MLGQITQGSLPPTITALQVCHLAVREDYVHVAIKLVFAIALAWIVFGGIIVFLGTRNRWAAKALVTYGSGLFASLVVFVSIAWNSAISCSAAQRLMLLLVNVGLPVVGCGVVIAILAGAAGVLTRRKSTSRVY